MSEDNDNLKSAIYQRSFGHILNLEERGLAQDVFSTAWDYQQKIIDAKDKEIENLKPSNKKNR